MRPQKQNPERLSEPPDIREYETQQRDASISGFFLLNRELSDPVEPYSCYPDRKVFRTR